MFIHTSHNSSLRRARASVTALCFIIWCSGCALLQSNFSTENNPNQSNLAASYPGDTSVPKEMQRSFEQALALQEAGDEQRALGLFVKIHQEYTSYSGAALNIALMVEAQDLPKAKVFLLEAITRQPNNYFALNRLGVVERKLNQFQQAAEYYQKAIDLKPDYASAWYNLAIINEVYLGQHQAAIDAYTQYQGLLPEPNTKLEKRIKRIQKRLPKEPKE